MSTGRITTHALDLQRAKPAEGMAVGLWRIEGDARRQLSSAVLNKDGRADEPLLSGGELERGDYELQFEVGSYYGCGDGGQTSFTPFEMVAIRFRVADESQHYHIPLLIAPGGYSTYRGS
ncbi:hydroxyisourate hydrolase [Paenibacillus kobensis]|uniref:hydroxyisourate hydrolase n=1 Tax=Paenibacillus kobensis TaxID=59841 RepID=UPI0013E34D4B|nr:hydroxyisourate hydrolase [Paenibacillus kobensis]